jgi:hypothetical protein
MRPVEEKDILVILFTDIKPRDNYHYISTMEVILFSSVAHIKTINKNLTNQTHVPIFLNFVTRLYSYCVNFWKRYPPLLRNVGPFFLSERSAIMLTNRKSHDKSR